MKRKKGESVIPYYHLFYCDFMSTLPKELNCIVCTKG